MYVIIKAKIHAFASNMFPLHTYLCSHYTHIYEYVLVKLFNTSVTDTISIKGSLKCSMAHAFFPSVFNLTSCLFTEVHGFDLLSSTNITSVSQSTRQLKA